MQSFEQYEVSFPAQNIFSQEIPSLHLPEMSQEMSLEIMI